MLTGSTLCNSFRGQLLQGVHDFDAGGDTIMLALYTNQAQLDSTTEAYTSAGEVSGPGYAAGGLPLVSQGVFVTGTVGYVTFAPLAWPGATFTVRGMLLYNASKANAAISVGDFGQDRTVVSDTFTVTFTYGDPNTAPIQVR